MQLIGSFVAFDNDGKDYTILVYSLVNSTMTPFPPNQPVPVFNKKLTLDDGVHVNRISKGVYEFEDFMQGKIRLTSDDPDAL